jgi:hypothetical protein
MSTMGQRHTARRTMTFVRRVLCLGGAFYGASVMPLEASTGTRGASFLEIPVGGAPAALGSAYTALAADAYAPVWNPAGLGFVSGTEVAGQHLTYLESVRYEYLGLAQTLGRGGSLGAAVQYLGSGDLAGTDNFGNPTGDYSNYFAAYSLAYGQALGGRFAVGLTGKWISARISDFSANAYAVDLGGMYRPADAWSIGASVANIGSKLKFLYTGDSLPLAGRLGVAFRPNSRWLISTEGVYEAARLAHGHAGIAWRPIDLLALRAGYKTDTTKELSSIAGLSAGVGIFFWGHELDYAWLPLGELGNTHYFSFVLRFGERTDKRRNLIRFRPIRVHPVVRRQTDELSDAELDEILQLITAPEKETLATTGMHPGETKR